MYRTNLAWKIASAFVVLIVPVVGCDVVGGILQGTPSGLEVCNGKPAGTPLSQQEHGDCQTIVCDINGLSKRIAAPNDNDDGNPCTEDACINGQAVHTLIQGPVACYSGPAGTNDVGICHSGEQICANGEAVGTCVGEQLPQTERCDAFMTHRDEDCDGLVDEDGKGCSCGDGIVQTDLGEVCDDGNDDPSDRCTTECKPARCGDGFLHLGHEECDDKNTTGGDSCREDCTRPVCGDGLREGGEACDDGNTINGDACPANCQRTITAVAAGANHTCALIDDGSIKCWGANDAGQLGLGDTEVRGDEPHDMGHALPVVDVGAKATAIAAGGRHTCALLHDGMVKCWGYGGHGELGLGNRQNRGDDPNEMGDALPVIELGTDSQGKPWKASAIAAGDGHTCALLAGGVVKCWGANGAGQLGRGDRLNRGDLPAQMGDQLPIIALGSGKAVTAISAGLYHTCALLNDGSIKCWGSNLYGQLGLGDTTSRGDKAGQMGDNLPSVDLGSDPFATSIATGDRHTCALRANGAVVCWGAGSRGQTGAGAPHNLGDEPNEMGANLMSVDLGWMSLVGAISAGGQHTCAFLGNFIKCWGANNRGQLGLEDSSDRGVSADQMGDALFPVFVDGSRYPLAVFAGQAHTCAILTEGRLKCWGNNTSGQLGLGDAKLAPGLTSMTMSDALPEIQIW